MDSGPGPRNDRPDDLIDAPTSKSNRLKRALAEKQQYSEPNAIVHKFEFEHIRDRAEFTFDEPVAKKGKHFAFGPSFLKPAVTFNIKEDDSTEQNPEFLLNEINNENPDVRIRQLYVANNKIDRRAELSLKLISQIRQDNLNARKTAIRNLVGNASSLGASTLFTLLAILLKDLSLSDQERFIFIKITSRLVTAFGPDTRPFTEQVLDLAKVLLQDQDKFVYNEGRNLIGNLYNAVGLKSLLETVVPTLEEQLQSDLGATVAIVSEICRVCPVDKSNMFFTSLCLSKQSWTLNDLGLRALQTVAKSLGNSVLPRLSVLVSCASHCLDFDNPKVVVSAAMAITALATAANPFGIELFEIALNKLWAASKHANGRRLGAILTALAAMVPLMDDNTASVFTKHLMQVIVAAMNKADDTLAKPLLVALEACLNCLAVDVEYIRQEVCERIFETFWRRRLADDKRAFWLIVHTTKLLASNVGAGEVVDYLLAKNVFGNPSANMRKMALETLAKIAVSNEELVLSKRSEILLIDALDSAVAKSTSLDLSLISAVEGLFQALESSAYLYIEPFVHVVLSKLSSPVEESRELAAQLLSKLAPIMALTRNTKLLTMCSSTLFEQLGEDNPYLLSHLLNAIKSILEQVGANEIQPPVQDLLPRLLPILRNKSEIVQESDILLVKLCADKAASQVNAREWLRICYELMELFRSTRKSVRKTANDALGSIASAVGPQDVLSILVNNMKAQDRQSRVSTAVAVAIVADKCEPFSVIPLLLNEYSSPDITIQITVLKTVSFLAEYVGFAMADYTPSLMNLLEHALTDKNQVKRQTASEIVKHLALNCAGTNNDELFIHVLNLLMPSIFESSPHVITRVKEAFTSLRYSVGFGASMSYLWAGLFHPARKVRDIYWKLFNDAYIQNSDAIVPYYPLQVKGASIWF